MRVCAFLLNHVFVRTNPTLLASASNKWGKKELLFFPVEQYYKRTTAQLRDSPAKIFGFLPAKDKLLPSAERKTKKPTTTTRVVAICITGALAQHQAAATVARAQLQTFDESRFHFFHFSFQSTGTPGDVFFLYLLNKV